MFSEAQKLDIWQALHLGRYSFRELSSFQFISWNRYPQALQDAYLQSTPLREIVDDLIAYDSTIQMRLQRCDECNEWMCASYSVPLTEEHGGTIRICGSCTERMWCWSDGTYRRTREPRRPVLIGYHGSDRNRLYRNVDFRDPGLLGLELEVYVKSNADKIEMLAAELQQMGVQVETDSSLDRYHGIECVFAPINLNALGAGCVIHRACKHMQENNTIAWDAGSHYGMHISINASRMTNLHAAKFCSFINGSKEFCERVAGRPENRYAEYFSTRLPCAGSGNKYWAASRRSQNRIEVRIFRSSLFFPRIKRNCEFVDSVREFTKHASIRDLSVINYMDWLNQECHSKKSKTSYEFIKDFLRLTRRSMSEKEITKEIAFVEEDLCIEERDYVPVNG